MSVCSSPVILEELKCISYKLYEPLLFGKELSYVKIFEGMNRITNR